MKYLYLTLVFVVCLMSCQNDNSDSDTLSLLDFEQSLKIEMTYDEIVTLFGDPESDIGSGIHVYVYQLDDSSEIWIGYTDQILYARHMSSEKVHLADLL